MAYPKLTSVRSRSIACGKIIIHAIEGIVCALDAAGQLTLYQGGNAAHLNSPALPRLGVFATRNLPPPGKVNCPLLAYVDDYPAIIYCHHFTVVEAHF